MQRMRKLISLLCLAPLFISLPILANTYDEAEPVIVHGEAGVPYYSCKPGEPINPAVIKYFKQRTVEDAESKCSWEEGRPVVKRVGEWDVDVSCYLIDFTYSSEWLTKGVIKADFRCTNS